MKAKKLANHIDRVQSTAIRMTSPVTWTAGCRGETTRIQAAVKAARPSVTIWWAAPGRR